MLWVLRILFLLVLGSMLWVTTWASLGESLFAIPAQVLGNRWFIATLFDAAWGFITFFVWVAWKEQSTAARLLWFVAIVGLGNIAMSAYLLVQLYGGSAAGGLEAVLTRRNPGKTALPAALAAATIGVYLAAALAASGPAEHSGAHSSAVPSRAHTA